MWTPYYNVDCQKAHDDWPLFSRRCQLAFQHLIVSPTSTMAMSLENINVSLSFGDEVDVSLMQSTSISVRSHFSFESKY